MAFFNFDELLCLYLDSKTNWDSYHFVLLKIMTFIHFTNLDLMFISFVDLINTKNEYIIYINIDYGNMINQN